MKHPFREETTVTCRRVTAYKDALTRGNFYSVVSYDSKKDQIRLCGDNGRTRWFPIRHFEPGEVTFPRLLKFEIVDDLETNRKSFIEVTVTLSTGELRWCIFATIDALAEWSEGPEGCIPNYLVRPYIIVAKALSEESIGRILKDLDDEDALISATLAVETEASRRNWKTASIDA